MFTPIHQYYRMHIHHSYMLSDSKQLTGIHSGNWCGGMTITQTNAFHANVRPQGILAFTIAAIFMQPIFQLVSQVIFGLGTIFLKYKIHKCCGSVRCRFVLIWFWVAFHSSDVREMDTKTSWCMVLICEHAYRELLPPLKEKCVGDCSCVDGD